MVQTSVFYAEKHSYGFSRPYSRVCRARRAVNTKSRASAARVLQKQLNYLPPDPLEGLLVPKEQFELLAKQLEKLNWAVYLVNDPAVETLSKDAPAPQTKEQNEDDYVYHFAYGANMNFYTLARRDVKALSRDPAKLVSDRYRLVFKHRGGYATVEEVGDNQHVKFSPFSTRVHGVLYKISKEDLKKLSSREGGYVLQQMQVETYDERVVTAWVFVSGRLSKLREEVAPTEKYMRKLRDGASDNYLDPLYQAWLSSIETVPSAGLPQEYFNTPSKYFAYGFLCIVATIVSGFFFQR